MVDLLTLSLDHQYRLSNTFKFDDFESIEHQ